MSNRGSSCQHLRVTNTEKLLRRLSSKKIVNGIRTQKLNCSHCSHGLSRGLWVCLNDTCDYVGCGRNDNQHALKHSKMAGDMHSLCIQIGSGQIWCYGCDEEVMEEDGARFGIDIAQVRAAVMMTPSSSSANVTPISPSGGVGGLVGLRNLGNTCYFNSALQCLSNIPSFSQHFVTCAANVASRSPDQIRTPRARMARHLLELFEAMWDVRPDGPRALSPANLLQNVAEVNPLFRGHQQHDSHELLQTLLSSLHEEIKEGMTDTMKREFFERYPPKKAPTPEKQKELDDQVAKQLFSSIVSQTFEGKLLSEVQCGNCHKISDTVDAFYDLAVSIPGKKQQKATAAAAAADLGPGSDGVGDQGGKQKSKDGGKGWLWGIPSLLGLSSGKGITLEDCIAGFCSREELQNTYKCEFCKTVSDAQKKFSMLELPEVLWVTIKRFKYDSYFASKVSTAVTFPVQELDMRPMLARRKESGIDNPLTNTKYELVGLVNHRGAVGGGHYVAYCRHPTTNRWYEFDDATVSAISEADVMKIEAYQLFYRLKPSEVEKREKYTLQQLHERDIKQQADKTHAISAAWLNRFNHLNSPGVITNDDFTCPHGRMDPNPKSTLRDMLDRRVVLVSGDVWKAMHTRYRGGPEVLARGGLEKCHECESARRKLQERRSHEKELIRKSDGTSITDCEYWWLIDAEWLGRWREFTSDDNDVQPPGPISNTNLLTKDMKVRSGLHRVKHYRGVNRTVWDIFFKIYGGGPVIPRTRLEIYSDPVPPNEAEQYAVHYGTDVI